MDLQYFLEMVDVKHRHGSHLRAYHSVWKKSPSNENFFYWLDYGDGKNVDLSSCPRDRLESDQVRYLSPEERRNYMVKVDDAGLFRWVKNDELVETNNKHFKDSLHGVVRIGDDAPVFHGNVAHPSSSSASSESSSPQKPSSPIDPSSQKDEEGAHILTDKDYQTQEVANRDSHVKPAAIYDHLAGRLSTRNDMWIFVSELRSANLR